MKKSIFFWGLSLLLFLTSLNSMGATAIAEDINKEKAANMNIEQKQERINQIVKRVNEIKEMDKSKLTPEDRQALRSELRGLKAEARGLGSRVYLSVGAIIIILLLLILIIH